MEEGIIKNLFKDIGYKQKLRIFVIITLVLAVAFVSLMTFIIKQNTQCLDHPFEYAAERLNKSGGNYACSCQSLDPELLSFTFDQNGINITKDSYINIIGGNVECPNN